MTREPLEAVTVSVGYSDFLAEVEPFNRPLLDRWLIVTSERDVETRDLCRQRGLECLVTEDFYRDDAAFDKAKGIDRALQQCTNRGWMLHLDADVVLPPHFRESLTDAHLDARCLYGCDRFMVSGWDSWQRLKRSGFFSRFSRSHHHNVCFPEGFPVGARWADTVQGYVPIGFFQLWSGPHCVHYGMNHRRYSPHGHNDAARTDVQFGLLWDRRHRVLLPEVVVGHLESEKAAVGVNWSGRKTRRFVDPATEGGTTR